MTLHALRPSALPPRSSLPCDCELQALRRVRSAHTRGRRGVRETWGAWSQGPRCAALAPPRCPVPVASGQGTDPGAPVPCGCMWVSSRCGHGSFALSTSRQAAAMCQRTGQCTCTSWQRDCIQEHACMSARGCRARAWSPVHQQVDPVGATKAEQTCAVVHPPPCVPLPPSLSRAGSLLGMTGDMIPDQPRTTEDVFRAAQHSDAGPGAWAMAPSVPPEQLAQARDSLEFGLAGFGGVPGSL